MKIKDLFNKLSTVVLMPVFGGICGTMGGSENSNKAMRRILIPLSLVGLAYQQTENPLVITIMSMCGVLSMGYGIPGGDDKGSFLGRFYYKLFKGNHKLTDIVTRGTIALIIGVSLISIPLIKHNWLIYGLCSLGIILTNSIISWRNLGQYALYKKQLNWSETITWGLITLFATIVIIF